MQDNASRQIIRASCVDCGVQRRIAAQGRCFSCYRRVRESVNPELAEKRRAQRRTYGRRKYEAQKLDRFADLIERIRGGLARDMRVRLDPESYAKFYAGLGPVLDGVFDEWYQKHDRRLKLMLQIEAIEATGKVAIVVADDGEDEAS